LLSKTIHFALERKKNERLLQEQNDQLLKAKLQAEENEVRLKLATVSAKLGIWDWNVKDNRMLWDDKMFELYGIANDSAVNTLDVWTNSLHPDDKQRAIDEFTAASQGEKKFDTTFRIIRPDGQVLYLKADAVTNKDIGGNGLQIVGVNRDITERKLAEEKIKASETRYRRLFESAKDGILILDAESGLIIDVNPFLITLLGYSKDQFLEKEIWELGFFKNIVANKDNFLELQQNEYIRYDDLPLETADGRKIDVEFVSNVYTVDTHKVIQCNIRDITDRKKAIAAHIASEIRYRRLFESAKDGILILDAETGLIMDVNPFLVELLSYSKDQFLEKEIWELGFFKNIVANKDNFLELQQKEYIRYDDLPLETADGRKIEVEFVSNVYLVDNHKVIQCNIRDITERKHAELQIQEKTDQITVQNKEYQQLNVELNQTNVELELAKDRAEVGEEKFKRMVYEMQIGVLLQGSKAEIKLSNPASLALLGLTEDQLLGRTSFDPEWNVIHEDGSPFPGPTHPVIVAIASGQAVRNVIMGVHRPDQNDRVWLLVDAIPQLDDTGAVVQVECTFIDITKLKQAELDLNQTFDKLAEQNNELVKTMSELQIAKEHAEESDRLKTAFLQNMSHEIRTPMNAIMGFSNLLVENFNNQPKLEKFADIINSRCNDLLDIINDILDIAKIESGQLTVNLEACPVQELFAELTVFFKEQQTRLDKQHIALQLRVLCFPPDIVIQTDKVKLKQILINLISNAFKFTETGSIEGACSFDINHNLRFYVTDTGKGIPADKHEKVFERFAQLDPGVNKLVSGTGLGLSIVKGLVSLLGGEIVLESEPGKGSTFSFMIPAEMVQTNYRQQRIATIRKNFYFPNKTVLIVEDDRYNAEYLLEILSDTGLTILRTAYGKDAVQIALNQTVDLVLMDIRLPDMDGYTAVRQIKEQKPTIKIIAQTAYAALDEKNKAFAVGCNGFISKPTKSNDLLAMIYEQLMG